MKKYLLVFFVVSLSIAFYMFHGIDDVQSSVEGELITRDFTFRYEFTNNSSDFIDDIEVVVLAPASGAANQRLHSIQADFDYRLEQDEHLNNYMFITLNSVKPFETRLINFKTTVSLGVKQKYNGGSVSPEKYVEFDDPVVKDKLISLNHENPDTKLLKKWLSTEIKKIGYVREDLGAKFALTQGHGDCTEYMYSALAAFRYNGIPARGVAGFIVDENNFERLFYHNWVEFVLDSKFKAIDVYSESSIDSNNKFLAMRVLAGDSTYFSNSQRFISVDERLTVRVL